MPIDASIYQNIRQPEAPNLLAQYGQMQQVQQGQQQNRLLEFKMQEAQRAQEDDLATRDAVKGFGTDTTANYNRLLSTGNIKAAGDYQTSVTNQQKAKRESDKAQIENDLKRLEAAGQLMAGVQDEATYAQARQAAARVLGPDVAARMPAVYTPEGVATIRQQALSMKDQLEQKWKAMEYTTPNANARLSADTSVRNNDASNATSRANNAATVGASYANAGAVREQAQATRDAAKIQTGFKNETELRKEFADLPEVKRYKSAYPSFKAIQDAAKTNNPQADINLIYGLAKLYDPESVVREGEYATIANSQAIPEWLKGAAQRLVGGGRLTPETKRQILEQADGRIAAFEGEYGKAKTSYEGIAKTRGIDTKAVFTDVGRTGNAPAAPAASGWGIQKVN